MGGKSWTFKGLCVALILVYCHRQFGDIFIDRQQIIIKMYKNNNEVGLQIDTLL